MFVNNIVTALLLSSADINDRTTSGNHELWKYAVITLGDTAHTQNLGFIMNQRVQNIDYKQLSKLYGLKYELPQCQIYCGGPVSTEKATIIHSVDYYQSSTQKINSQCSITFNDKIIDDINKKQGPKHWKVLLGYCMWHDGQLDAEIIKPGGWLEQSWDNTVWGEYKRKDKMWRRLIEKQSNRDAKKFLDKVFS